MWPAPVTPPAAKPSVPTGLTATPGDGKVTLSWNANPAAQQVDGYQVYRNDTDLDLDVDALTYVVTGLTNGQSYSFRVSAHNKDGYGDWTEAVTATPNGTPVPPPPEGVHLGSCRTTRQDSFPLTWRSTGSSQAKARPPQRFRVSTWRTAVW